MAQIKMDISEYEIMKDNKKLLENSLNRERELQKQVDSLNVEKIKALEDAKMKVVKVTKTEHSEVLLVKSNHFQDKMSHILRTLNSYPNFIYDSRLIEFAEKELFNKQTIYSHPIHETTIHGLDEVKAELRKDLEDGMVKDIKKKLELLQELQVKNKELHLKNNELSNENILLNNENDRLTFKIDEQDNELNLIVKFRELLDKKYNIFSAYNRLNQLKQLL